MRTLVKQSVHLRAVGYKNDDCLNYDKFSELLVFNAFIFIFYFYFFVFN